MCSKKSTVEMSTPFQSISDSQSEREPRRSRRNLRAIVRIPIVPTEHYNHEWLKEERACPNLQFSGHTPPVRHTRAGTGGRNWGRGHRGRLLTDLLLLACSVCFLIQHGAPKPRLAMPTVSWAFINQLSIKKNAPHLSPCISLMGTFSQLSFVLLKWL